MNNKIQLLYAIDVLKYYRKFHSCGPADCPCEYARLCNDEKKDNQLYEAIGIVLQELKRREEE